jgi:hypothetical protein
MLTEHYSRMLDHLKARYDLNAKNSNLFSVALQLWADVFDRWELRLAYIGIVSESRKQLASDSIDFWHRLREQELGRQEETVISIGGTTLSQWDQATITQLRDFYGRDLSEEEFEFERSMWAELDADMEAGKLSGESKAADYLRDTFARFPRIAGFVEF